MNWMNATEELKQKMTLKRKIIRFLFYSVTIVCVLIAFSIGVKFNCTLYRAAKIIIQRGY